MTGESRTEPVPFEQEFTELEHIVEKLEAGGLSLDETMTLYEAGMRLVRSCTQTIEQAEIRLVRLQETAEDLPF